MLERHSPPRSAGHGNELRSCDRQEVDTRMAYSMDFRRAAARAYDDCGLDSATPPARTSNTPNVTPTPDQSRSVSNPRQPVAHRAPDPRSSLRPAKSTGRGGGEHQ